MLSLHTHTQIVIMQGMEILTILMVAIILQYIHVFNHIVYLKLIHVICH